MTEWLAGPVFLYLDREGDKSDSIASVKYPYDGGKRPAAVTFYITTDLNQAERWRSSFAAGRWPDLSAAPPIQDIEQILERSSSSTQQS